MKDIEIIKQLNLLPKNIFSLYDLKKILKVGPKSLPTKVSRLAKKGILQPVSRGWYTAYGKTVIPEEVAHQLYYPSYLSLRTVLGKAGVINQIPQKVFLVTCKKSYQTKILDTPVVYRQLKKELFVGYYLDKGIPTAYPEKALLDLLYFVARGKGRILFSELDLTHLNLSRLGKFQRIYPKRVRQLVAKVEAGV